MEVVRSPLRTKMSVCIRAPEKEELLCEIIGRNVEET